MGLERRDRRLQRIGGMRIIDIDRGTLRRDHRPLQPPAHRLQAAERRDRRGDIAATRHHQASRSQCVGGLIGTDQWQRDLIGLALRLDHQPLPEQGRIAPDQLERFPRRADRKHAKAARTRHLGDASRGGIVRPHHRRAIIGEHFAEQAQLGIKIRRHRAVIIEMIAAEIGEGGCLHRQTFGAILRQAVARRLERDMAYAFALQPGDIGQKGDDVGRGQPGRNAVIGGGDAKRADRGCMEPRHPPQLPHHLNR